MTLGFGDDKTWGEMCLRVVAIQYVKSITETTISGEDDNFSCHRFKVWGHGGHVASG